MVSFVASIVVIETGIVAVVDSCISCYGLGCGNKIISGNLLANSSHFEKKGKTYL